MPDVDPANAALEPGFFDGRLMIDIASWDWRLRIRVVDPARTKPNDRFPGLDYGRDLVLRGPVRAPREFRGKSVEVTLSPFGPEVRFGRRGVKHVGALETAPHDSEYGLRIVLMLPEDAIASAITSLASSWKHLQIDTREDGPHSARIVAYHFHADIHPNLKAWADAD